MSNNLYDKLMKQGGPAFPITSFSDLHGMTLRDYFAGKVLNGMIQNDADGLARAINDGKGGLALTNTARLAYAIAGAMLLERER
jgi:hypothetical protein